VRKKETNHLLNTTLVTSNVAGNEAKASGSNSKWEVGTKKRMVEAAALHFLFILLTMPSVSSLVWRTCHMCVVSERDQPTYEVVLCNYTTRAGVTYLQMQAKKYLIFYLLLKK
jgi:hypothetical protein